MTGGFAGDPETIVAIATPQGVGGVGIIRLSGPDALAIAEALFRTPQKARPAVPLRDRESHRVHYGWLVDPRSERPLDEALVLVMRAPRSFTGEDVVELQTHGGPTVLHAVLGQCLGLGARLAAAGEFSKRAFLNGRLDLARAEATLDVIGARTERALAQALDQLEGGLSRAVAAVRNDVIGLLARLEAAIDYPDEIDDLPADELANGLAGLASAVAAWLATAHQGQIWREGATLAIVGRPNVGKSSLLNALLRRDRAIVTDIPGTTRDVLEEALNLEGVPFRVLDTAGIRDDTHDAIELIGIERSRQALAAADVVALVVDLSHGVGPEERQLRELVGDRPLVVVGNKRDRLAPGDDAHANALLASLAGDAPHAAIAATTGLGLPALERALAKTALGAAAAVSPTTVNARHRQALARAEASLLAAQSSTEAGLPADFVAIDLKDAIAALGEIAGDAIADEVIDQVFARFCVGK